MRKLVYLAALMAFTGAARAGEPYPFAGAYSMLEAGAEANYGMAKFNCLASFTIQHGDGSYVSYHIDTATAGTDKTMFHPYEVGTCAYTAATKMERCQATKSNWGQNEYFVEHAGEKDGATLLRVVLLKTPGQVTEIAMRKCPFDEAHIKPFLSTEFLNYSDDDFSWTLYRWLPFNPDLGPKIAKAIGIEAE